MTAFELYSRMKTNENEIVIGAFLKRKNIFYKMLFFLILLRNKELKKFLDIYKHIDKTKIRHAFFDISFGV